MRHLQAVVEATPNAVKTYQKCGFRIAIERMRFAVDEKYANRQLPELVFEAAV